MNRFGLTTAVAKATGESHATIKRLGFDLLVPPKKSDPPLPVIDCPHCGSSVVLAWHSNHPFPDVAKCHRCEEVFEYADHEVNSMDLTLIQA